MQYDHMIFIELCTIRRLNIHANNNRAFSKSCMNGHLEKNVYYDIVIWLYSLNKFNDYVIEELYIWSYKNNKLKALNYAVF